MMGRVKINVRNLNAPITGVQRYTLELITRFTKYEVTLITAPTKMQQGLPGHIWEQLILPSLVGTTDVLFSPANTGPLHVRRQVVTMHDVAVFDCPEGYSAKFVTFYRYLLKLLVHRVIKVITPSEFTRNRLLEIFGIDPQRVISIPLGVDSRFRPQQPELVEKVIRSLRIPTKHYVLSLGSIEPRKNIGRLIQAWEMVQEKLPSEIWLIIAGSKGSRRIFRQVALDRLPSRVHFAGRVPDELLPALYSGAISFLYTSLYEGFGLPPLEAMACGAPVLASNVSAMPEVVGDAGLMVDPSDVEAVAEGIRQLVDNSSLRMELSRKALQRSQRFTWETTARLTWNVLEEAINQ